MRFYGYAIYYQISAYLFITISAIAVMMLLEFIVESFFRSRIDLYLELGEYLQVLILSDNQKYFHKTSGIFNSLNNEKLHQLKLRLILRGLKEKLGFASYLEVQDCLLSNKLFSSHGDVLKELTYFCLVNPKNTHLTNDSKWILRKLLIIKVIYGLLIVIGLQQVLFKKENILKFLNGIQKTPYDSDTKVEPHTEKQRKTTSNNTDKKNCTSSPILEHTNFDDQEKISIGEMKIDLNSKGNNSNNHLKNKPKFDRDITVGKISTFSNDEFLSLIPPEPIPYLNLDQKNSEPNIYYELKLKEKVGDVVRSKVQTIIERKQNIQKTELRDMMFKKPPKLNQSVSLIGCPDIVISCLGSENKIIKRFASATHSKSFTPSSSTSGIVTSQNDVIPTFTQFQSMFDLSSASNLEVNNNNYFKNATDEDILNYKSFNYGVTNDNIKRNSIHLENIKLFDANGKPLRRIMIPGLGWVSHHKAQDLMESQKKYEFDTVI